MKLREGVDYYTDQGLFVLTEDFLRRRGQCCRNKCRHCPWGYGKKYQDSDITSSINKAEPGGLPVMPYKQSTSQNQRDIRMAITPGEASQVADDKKKLTPEEIKQADEVENQIDLHVKRSYDGHGKVVVSIQRPAPRVILELERRYVKAGWRFDSSSGESGRAGQGFSITLTTLPQSR